MLIRDAMTRDPSCCRENDDGNVAARIFWEQDCGCVPLVNDEGKLRGMVTDRDLCLAAFFAGSSLGHIRLGDLVEDRAAWSCRGDQSVEEGAELMSRHKVRRLPVIDANERVIGLLSLNDIAVARKRRAQISSETLADTLGDICERRAA